MEPFVIAGLKAFQAINRHYCVLRSSGRYVNGHEIGAGRAQDTQGKSTPDGGQSQYCG